MNLLDHPNFYPILQPTDWRGASQCVTRCITGRAKVDQEMPLLVSYGVSTETQNSYASLGETKKLEKGLVDLDRRAKENWAQLARGKKWERLDGNGYEFLMWPGEEDVTSSGLLFKAILRPAHQLLNAETIYVSTPHRYALVAAANADALAAITLSMYQEARNQGGPYLSPFVFEVREGRVVGPVDDPALSIHAGAAQIVHDTAGEVFLAERVATSLAATFLVVGGADGDIDEAEAEAFFKGVAGMRQSDQLHEDIVRGIDAFLENPDLYMGKITAAGGSGGAMIDFLGDTARGFDEQHGEEAGNLYRGFISILSEMTARASGDGDSNIDAEEARTLEYIRQALQSGDEPTWSRRSFLAEANGARILVVQMSCESLEELAYALGWEFDAWSGDVERLDAIDGEIRVEIDASRFPITETAKKEIAANLTRLNQLAKETGFKTPAGKQIFMTGTFAKP